MDSSVYKYALMKYIESMMAGCLVIADVPNDYPNFFSEHIVVVDTSMSDKVCTIDIIIAF